MGHRARAKFYNKYSYPCCQYGEMDSTPAISELKLSFIRAQVRILSESLEPPENWRSYAVQSEEDLSDKVVEDALHKCTVV